MPTRSTVPDFDGEGVALQRDEEGRVITDDVIDEEDLEGKQTEDDESSEDEDVQSDASTGKQPNADSVDDEEQRELSALAREKEKLKQQIVEYRRQRRELREQDASTTEKQTTDDDLADLDPEEIARLERVMRARGFASKEELREEAFREQQKEIESEFFKQHPEYTPDKDEDDILYDALRKEFSLYAKPKNATEVRSILQRAHREVVRQFPNQFSKSNSSTRSTGGRQQVASVGAGVRSKTGSSGKASGSTLTAAQKAAFRQGGWTDEEIAEMDS